jgi:hypothetical protein
MLTNPANFGFFDLTMDKLFGTFNEIVPNNLAILEAK